MKGRQRHKCKACGYNYTVDDDKVSAKDKKRRFALSLYLEGLGFHSIARLLNVSHVTVINWILVLYLQHKCTKYAVKKFGASLSLIRNSKPVKIMELDEMHTYIGSKKTTDGFASHFVQSTSGLALIEKHENTLIWLLETEAHPQV